MSLPSPDMHGSKKFPIPFNAGVDGNNPPVTDNSHISYLSNYPSWAAVMEAELIKWIFKG